MIGSETPGRATAPPESDAISDSDPQSPAGDMPVALNVTPEASENSSRSPPGPGGPGRPDPGDVPPPAGGGSHTAAAAGLHGRVSESRVSAAAGSDSDWHGGRGGRGGGCAAAMAAQWRPAQ